MKVTVKVKTKLQRSQGKTIKVNTEAVMVKQRWKYFHQQRNLSKLKVKTVKRTKRLEDENKAWRDIFSEIFCLGHSFAEISYLSHSFLENIVDNPRWILEK